MYTKNFRGANGYLIQDLKNKENLDLFDKNYQKYAMHKYSKNSYEIIKDFIKENCLYCLNLAEDFKSVMSKSSKIVAQLYFK